MTIHPPRCAVAGPLHGPGASGRRRDQGRLATALSLLFALCAAPVIAEDKAAEPQLPPTFVKTYAIDDLIQSMRDYPFDAGIVPPTRLMPAEAPTFPTGVVGAVGGGGFMITDSNDEETPGDAELAEMIVDLIQRTIDPDNWRENGGLIGSIAQLNNRLIVRQTEQNHEQVAILLSDLRKSAAPLTIRARWVRLTDEEAGDTAKLNEFIGANRDRILYQAQTTCFNGQMVFIAAGRGKTVVLESQPVVGNGAVGYYVTPRMVHVGAILQIKPMMDETKSVVLDVRSVVSEDLSTGSAIELVATSELGRPASGDGRGRGIGDTVVGAVDRLDFAIQHFSTTTKGPLNTPIIVGGTTMRGEEDDPTPLYLVIEVMAD